MLARGMLSNFELRRTGISFFWIFIFLSFGIGMICFPVVVLRAARRGLEVWWEIVLPSLLPFFIISDLLMNLGFIAFFGTFLEPVMRPLFNLPGSGGFILAVSYLSGFPLCAVLTARLRQTNLCTKDEGERLLSFTSNASPLFMLGAVSAGMFQNPALGPLIAGIHYFSNFLCGVILKFFSRISPGHPPRSGTSKESLLASALRAFQKASRLTEQGFGALLGETIRNTTITLLTIGGFITLFSVLLGILQAVGFFAAITKILNPLAAFFNFDPSLFRPLLYGFFEITIGINEASKVNGSLLQQLMMVEAILAWNGLAVQAQVAGMVAGSDLRILTYILTRFLQAAIAVSLTCIFTCSPVQAILAISPRDPLVWAAVFLTGAITFCIISFARSFRKKVIIIR